MQKIFSSPLALLLALCISTNALAHDSDKGNIITFAVEHSEQVDNNHAFAVLGKTVQAKDAATLAKQTNPIINKALAIAKKYPTVKVSSGQPAAYPSYDDKGNITGMTSQARLNLNSQDINALSALIGELQPLLVLERMRFDVSSATKAQIQQQLMVTTSKKFQQQAEDIAKIWGAKGYKLIQVNLDNQSTPPHYPMPMAMSAKYADSAPTLEAGDTELSYRISGSIFLVY